MVVGKGQVVSCSPAARAEGVRRGQRRREAQARCPGVRVVPSDPARDQRLFDPLVERLEEVASGVQVMRPGLVALKAQGLARYYGGEREAADAMIDALASLDVLDVRVGVADGVFAAEQAAYAGEPVCVVDGGGSAAFLAPLPVNRLGDAELAALLPRLGLEQLGEFAALDVAHVRNRFGERGVRLHALASGADPRPVLPRTPLPELACVEEFDEPLALADQVAFAMRPAAGRFIAGLAAVRLVCTELRVTITAEEGEVAERVWLHPAAFDEPAVVDRVRWQLQAASSAAVPGEGIGEAFGRMPGRVADGGSLDGIAAAGLPYAKTIVPARSSHVAVGGPIHSPIVQVRLEPVAVDAAAHYEPRLFGAGVDERVHHTLSRVQSLVGHAGVVTASVGGGRWLAERQVLTPWGDRPVSPLPADRPWPGHLPPPLPAAVFPVPRPVELVSASGVRVAVDDRGTLSAAPAMLLDEDDRHRVTQWAGPWPIDERTWSPERHRSACRFQVVDAMQGAWLLVLDDGGEWWAEGRYD